MAVAQPFLQMETWMTEMSDAIARIEANLDSVMDEIAQVTQVLTDLAAQPQVDQGTTDQLNAIADRLQAAKDALENATTMDDPAAPPADVPPADQPPADVPADQPPASGDPGAADAPVTEPPADVQPGDAPPADAPPADDGNAVV